MTSTAPSTSTGHRTVVATTELLFGVESMPRRVVQASFGAAAPAIGMDGRPRDGEVRTSDAAGQSGDAGRPRASFAEAGTGRVGDAFRDERAAQLATLRAEHDAQCPHCTTATSHTNTVFGEGDPCAQLMFVGEAPGETEDRLGRPFVGRAGEKLDEIIRAMSLGRDQVYIANVLKSRPPGNRAPLQHEVEACGPYLHRQIAIVRPLAIVTLGGPASKLLLGAEQGITRLRGIWSKYRDGALEIPVMPTFHPAYLLRNYTPQTRREVWEDMQKVMELLGIR